MELAPSVVERYHRGCFRGVAAELLGLASPSPLDRAVGCACLLSWAESQASLSPARHAALRRHTAAAVAACAADPVLDLWARYTDAAVRLLAPVDSGAEEAFWAVSSVAAAARALPSAPSPGPRVCPTPADLAAAAELRAQDARGRLFGVVRDAATGRSFVAGEALIGAPQPLLSWPGAPPSAPECARQVGALCPGRCEALRDVAAAIPHEAVDADGHLLGEAAAAAAGTAGVSALDVYAALLASRFRSVPQSGGGYVCAVWGLLPHSCAPTARLGHLPAPHEEVTVDWAPPRVLLWVFSTSVRRVILRACGVAARCGCRRCGAVVDRGRTLVIQGHECARGGDGLWRPADSADPAFSDAVAPLRREDELEAAVNAVLRNERPEATKNWFADARALAEAVHSDLGGGHWAALALALSFARFHHRSATAHPAMEAYCTVAAVQWALRCGMLAARQGVAVSAPAALVAWLQPAVARGLVAAPGHRVLSVAAAALLAAVSYPTCEGTVRQALQATGLLPAALKDDLAHGRLGLSGEAALCRLWDAVDDPDGAVVAAVASDAGSLWDEWEQELARAVRRPAR